MIPSPKRHLVRLGACTLLLALGVAGDRITAQSALPTYEVSKEGQFWEYAGHIGAGLDLDRCFNGSIQDRLFGNVNQECLDNLQPNQMWEPTGFATYQSDLNDPSTYRVLVADRMNQRLVVFGWQTSLTGVGTPNGQHIVTVETFNSPVDTDGDGFPNTTLSVPESVSVDAAGNIIIADSGNARLLVLDAAYQYQYEISYGTPAQVGRFESPFPYYLVLTPGTVVQQPGTCNPATPAPGRILVGNTSPFGSDNANGDDPTFLNQIVVYDGAFCELSRIGTASQLGSSAFGEFKGFNGLAFDAEGRLFVGDYGNARVQAFLPTGWTNPADPFTFTSFDPVPVLSVDDPAPTALPIEPWGVMIDDRNRLVIAQPNRERISVFDLDWDGPGPIATPAFELTALGQIQGAPHHVERDSWGRWLVSTPFTDQIDVFITPELAVFDQIAMPVDTDNDTALDSIRVEFSVATPLGQLPRPNVHPFAAAAPQQVGDPTGLGAPAGPFPSPLPVGPGDFPAEGTDIDPGTYARWYFLFPITDPSLSTASLNVWATSSGGSDPLVTAPSKTARTLIPTCASAAPPALSHVKIFDVNDLTRVPPRGPMGNDVYGPDSEIRISATDADGVVSVHYQFSTSMTPVDTLGNQTSVSMPLGFDKASHTIKYWAIDGCNDFSEGQIDIYVDYYFDPANYPPNNPPIVADRQEVTAEDTAISLNLLTGVTDADGDRLATSATGTPAHGTLARNPGGTYTYTPHPNYYGPDAFTFSVTDGTDTTTRTVFVSVTPVNDAPVAVNDTIATAEDTAATIFPLTNDSDVDGGPLAITGFTQPASGAVSAGPVAGSLRYTSPANFPLGHTPAMVSFSYTVSDGRGGVTSAHVNVEVTAVNDLPDAVNDAASTNGASSVTIPIATLLANDSDPDRDTLMITSVTQGSRGTVVLNTAAGTVKYTVGLAASSDTFSYTVSDGFGGFDTATVTVQLNRPPVCGGATASPAEIWPPNHKTSSVNVRGVSDPDGNPLTITITRILQDEPTKTNGDGKTWIDGGGVNTSTAWVRGERMGGENGRIYQIFFTAKDASGGSCTGKVTVGVPHDQGRHGRAVDSGCRWDSTVKSGPRLSCAPGGDTYAGGGGDDDDDDDDDDHGHHQGDQCDHDRKRNDHRDGDDCEHDRHSRRR